MKTKETSKFKEGDTIICIKSFWNAETQSQVKEGYIVRNMTQFGIDCLSHPECWKKIVKTVSGIEQNFQEEFQEMLEEADYWDGDETDKINY